MSKDFEDNNNYLFYFDDNQNPNIELEEVQNNETFNNVNPFFDLNEKDFNQENQNQDFSSSFIDSYTASNLDKFYTNCETLKKKRKEKEKNNQEIRNIFKNKNYSELYDKIIKSKNIEDDEYKLCNKKGTSKNNKDDEYKFCNKKREKESFVSNKKEKEKEKEEPGDNISKIKRGRKVKPDNKEHYKKEHNKNSEDNKIIKKIKENLLLYPLMFLNNLIKNNNSKRRLYKSDNKYTNQWENMDILKKSLKELYTLDISPNSINLNKDFNKDCNKTNIIIENKEIENDPTIMFALNLSFGDCMKLFFYKKNIDEIIQKYHKNEGNVNKETIKNNLMGVEDLFSKILAENDKD